MARWRAIRGRWTNCSPCPPRSRPCRYWWLPWLSRISGSWSRAWSGCEFSSGIRRRAEVSGYQTWTSSESADAMRWACQSCWCTHRRTWTRHILRAYRPRCVWGIPKAASLARSRWRSSPRHRRAAWSATPPAARAIPPASRVSCCRPDRQLPICKSCRRPAAPHPRRNRRWRGTAG